MLPLDVKGCLGSLRPCAGHGHQDKGEAGGHRGLGWGQDHVTTAALGGHSMESEAAPPSLRSRAGNSRQGLKQQLGGPSNQEGGG